jgi:hypothetical protein
VTVVNLWFKCRRGAGEEEERWHSGGEEGGKKIRPLQFIYPVLLRPVRIPILLPSFFFITPRIKLTRRRATFLDQKYLLSRQVRLSSPD